MDNSFNNKKMPNTKAASAHCAAACAGEASESSEGREKRRGESGVQSLRRASSGCGMEGRRRMGADATGERRKPRHKAAAACLGLDGRLTRGGGRDL